MGKGKGGNSRINWTEDHSHPFINPYNFVRTTESVDRRPVEKGELSGYVTCTVTVKDMLALPDIAQEPDAASQKYDFFSVDGKPLIPGSEIRGCIRSAFEAVTKSCYSVINSNLLSKRMPKPTNDRLPGLLKREGGKWVIYNAEYCRNRHKLKEFENGVHCDCVRKWFKLSETPEINETYFFAKRCGNRWENSGAVCTDDDIEKLMNILDVYFENIKKSDKGEAPQLRNIIRDMQEKLSKMKSERLSKILVPVFYKKRRDRTLEYLSPAQTGRVSFKNTVSSLLDEHNPCGGKDGKYCPACSLFGTLGQNAPLASRLRFFDAKEKTAGSVKLSDKYIILPELSSPKLSTAEFYSLCGDEFKNVKMWDYDTEGVKLRGRKFYFHSVHKEAKELGKRQIAVKTALANSEFEFKLYFDGIKEEELHQLLWVLTIGQNKKDGNQMHKLGMGKPAGYGSVKITVDNIKVRNFDTSEFSYSLDNKSYEDYMKDFEPKEYFDSAALDDFKIITDYDLIVKDNKDKTRVVYPIAKRTDKGSTNANAEAGHQWFSANRKPNGTIGTALPVLNRDTDSLRMPEMHGKPEIIPNKSQNDRNYSYGGQNKRQGKRRYW